MEESYIGYKLKGKKYKNGVIVGLERTKEKKKGVFRYRVNVKIPSKLGVSKFATVSESYFAKNKEEAMKKFNKDIKKFKLNTKNPKKLGGKYLHMNP